MNDKEQIKSSLNKLSESLDQDTLNQLDKARQTAIATNNKSRWYQKLSWPVLGPALAASVLVVVLLVSSGGNRIEPKTDMFLDDLYLLANEFDSDLLQDLEFIAWLEEENIFEGELL